jgi:hypothetical protein
MRKLFADKDFIYHLQEHAILENEDGTYEYVAWDTKGEKLSWIQGQAIVIEDVLCLISLTSEGEEESIETPLELEYELNQLPKWDKTKYYCVVVGGQQAALLKYCETGEPLDEGENEYSVVKELLHKHGVRL